MKAVILARVSTSKQEAEGLSLRDIQLPQLREYALEKNFKIDKEFVFSETADQKIRTKFNEMIDYVRDNDEIKIIIAYRVDRITRNFSDAVLIDTLIKDYKKEVHFVNDRLVINKDSVGRDIQDWDLKVFLGKQYINRLREDGKNSANFKLNRGEWPGLAPFGYKNISLDRRKKWVEPDGISAEVVKSVFQWYSTGGYSMSQIEHKVKQEFNIEIYKAKIDLILKNKFYFGVMEFGGKEYSHNYEKLITEELYSKVQKIKASYSKQPHKYAGLPFLYRGLIRCDHCGNAISPERKKDGKYIYYKCTEYHGKHGAKYISEESITQQLTNIYRRIEVPKWVIDEITSTLKESYTDKQEYATSLLTHYRKEYDKYTKRINGIYFDKLDGAITVENHASMLEDFRAKQADLQTQMNALDKADEAYYQSAEMVLNFCNKASELFESSEAELKKLCIKLTLQNLRLKEDKLVYEWVKPFDVIFVHADRLEWHARQDSNL